MAMERRSDKMVSPTRNKARWAQNPRPLGKEVAFAFPRMGKWQGACTDHHLGDLTDCGKRVGLTWWSLLSWDQGKAWYSTDWKWKKRAIVSGLESPGSLLCPVGIPSVGCDLPSWVEMGSVR